MYIVYVLLTVCIFFVCSGWHTLSQLCIRIQTLTERYTEAGRGDLHVHVYFLNNEKKNINPY